MIDIEKEIVDYLKDHATSLRALTGGGARVWGGPSLPPSYKPDQGGALLIRVRGGQVNYTGKVFEPTVEGLAYGSTLQQAVNVDRALFDDFHECQWRNILMALLDVPGQSLEEPTTNWPLVLSRWSIKVRNA